MIELENIKKIGNENCLFFQFWGHRSVYLLRFRLAGKQIHALRIM